MERVFIEKETKNAKLNRMKAYTIAGMKMRKESKKTVKGDK